VLGREARDVTNNCWRVYMCCYILLQALSLSPVCPEAYNVLAVAQADTYEQALALYRRAEELGPKVTRAWAGGGAGCVGGGGL
jgi:lipoprotein NlpI